VRRCIEQEIGDICDTVAGCLHEHSLRRVWTPNSLPSITMRSASLFSFKLRIHGLGFNPSSERRDRFMLNRGFFFDEIGDGWTTMIQEHRLDCICVCFQNNGLALAVLLRIADGKKFRIFQPDCANSILLDAVDPPRPRLCQVPPESLEAVMQDLATVRRTPDVIWPISPAVVTAQKRIDPET